MKNKMVKVGTCVPSMRIADVYYNVQQIEKMILEHQDCGILVFPELSLCGYTCLDLLEQNTLLEACLDGLEYLKKVSAKVPNTLFIVGTPMEYRSSLYNVAVSFNQGEIVSIVPKTYLPNYREFQEKRYFESATNLKDAYCHKFECSIEQNGLLYDETSGVSVGIEICEDLWAPNPVSTKLAVSGAKAIVNLSASNEIVGKKEYRRSLVLHQSAATMSAYLYASSGSDESSTDLVFSGHCMIAENGVMKNEMIYEGPNSCITSIIDFEKLEKDRLVNTSFQQSSDEVWWCAVSILPLGGEYEVTPEEMAKLLKQEGVTMNRYPFVPQSKEVLHERAFEILNLQARGLVTRTNKTGIKNLVLGVSGGLDSTLALLVCHIAQQLDPSLHIIGVTMPKRGNTSEKTYQNALSLMDCLKVESKEIELGDEVSEHLKAIGHPGSYQGEQDTTYENAQARMRTYLLMDLANYKNGLVIGTGDLSELALGWCTYNGDHMSMYAVNSSVPKTLVQYIVKEYALGSDDEDLKRVLLDIVETPISPELVPNKDGQIAQKTEEKIGKYDLNDFFLYETLRYGFSVERILADALLAYEEISKADMIAKMKRFYQRFFTQQFKRSCMPDGPKIGSVSLSPRGDWRMPSDASYRMYLDILDNL